MRKFTVIAIALLFFAAMLGGCCHMGKGHCGAKGKAMCECTADGKCMCKPGECACGHHDACKCKAGGECTCPKGACKCQ